MSGSLNIRLVKKNNKKETFSCKVATIVNSFQRPLSWGSRFVKAAKNKLFREDDALTFESFDKI